MNASAKDIENRPKELLGLPKYGFLPDTGFYIDLEGSIGQFLFNDISDLDGVQPIEDGGDQSFNRKTRWGSYILCKSI
ncbi:hypothetical protein ACK3XA_28750 [Klebsiella grimontii]|uniref:hypothetical protein n=1 Tax=Klebsiella grimontii TaxID=2058152 RepID=UPI00391A4CE7